MVGIDKLGGSEVPLVFRSILMVCYDCLTIQDFLECLGFYFIIAIN